MNLELSRKFIKEYRKLPPQIQAVVDKQLDLFLKNPDHPSLRVKKMQGAPNIWEARITKSYRFTFHIKGGVVVLRTLGTHDILNKP